MPGKCVRVLLSFVLLLPTLLNAGVLFTEAFSYPDGPLVTVADGRWKTHSGTPGQAEVDSGALHLSEKETEDVSAPFPSGLQGPSQTAALYASFKAVLTALPSGPKGGYFAHFKDAAATTGIRCRIFATTDGAAPGMFRLGIASAASTASSVVAQDLKLGVSCQVVCRMTLADNVCTLWINPVSESQPGASSSDTATAKSVAAFAFRQSRSGGSGMGELKVDDLRVATTFAEVRPASAANPTRPANRGAPKSGTVISPP